MSAKYHWINILVILCLVAAGTVFQPAISPNPALAEGDIPPVEESQPAPTPYTPPAPAASALTDGLEALEHAIDQGPAAVLALRDSLHGEALDIAMADIVRAAEQLARSAPPSPEAQAISPEEESAALQADLARAAAERALALTFHSDPAGDLPDFPASPPPAASNPNAPAADLTVGSAPCQYPTINAAMAAANNGDRLLLEGGVTFYENLSVQKSLTFEGGYSGCGSGSSDPTTIDGGGVGRVMYIHPNLNITLQNLNITNGSWAGNGAGVFVSMNTHLTGINLEIFNNTSTALGGGLRLWGATAVFTDTNIYDNTAASGAGVYAEFYNGYAPSLDLHSYADVYDNTSTGSGGGVYMSEGEIFITSSSDIYSNEAADGGGAYLITSTLTIEGEYSEIMVNTASNNGGGIYALGSTINLDDQAELYNNQAGSNGGGAYLDNSDLWSDRASIYYNQASGYGGGVYAANDSLLDMDLGGYPCQGPRCSQFSYNTAGSYGGGAYANGDSEIDLRQIFVEGNEGALGGGLYTYQSPVYLYNTLFAHNNATSTSGDGLRLYTGTSLSGTHNTFAHNNAGGAQNGRAIDLFSANLNLSNSIVWGHASSISPLDQIVTCSDIQGGYAGTGNIDADPLFVSPTDSNFHLQHTSPAIDRCTSDQTYDFDNELRPVIYTTPATPYDMGADEASARVGINGAACAYGRIQDAVDAAAPGDTIQAASGTYIGLVIITSKDLTVAGGYDINCSTYITGTTTVDGNNVSSGFEISDGTVMLRDLQITHGNAGNGGGIRSLSSAQVTLDHVQVFNNQASNGGGIYIGGSSVLTMTNDTDIYDNVALLYGGGVRLWGKLVSIDWLSTINDNQAPNGGGVSVPGGVLVLNSGHVMSNDATDAAGLGGGIHVYDSGVITITASSNVAANTAFDGGGIYADNARLYLRSMVHSNAAASNGGGIYLANGSSLTASNTSIGHTGTPTRGNTAILGAGMYLDNSSLDFSGQIINNIASSNGGGVYASASALTFTNTSIGGAGTNQPNQIGPTGHFGAGIYLTLGATASFADSSIEGNLFQTADWGYGGGAYITDSSALTLTQSTIANHTAPDATLGRGAGIYMSYNSTLTLDASQVLSNTAGAGGGIRLYDSGTINILNGSELRNNAALNDEGGAIAASGAGAIDINISDANLINNHAGTHGGAIYTNYGSLDFTGGWELSDNVAGLSGGAVYVDGDADAAFRASGGPGYLRNNQAGSNGGALFLNNNKTMELHATSGYPLEISGNTAVGDGGAAAAVNGGYFDNYGQLLISGNTAGGNGGAFHLSSGARIWWDDYTSIAPQILSNVAQNGGAIYAQNSPNVRCDGATFSANTASSGDGGAFYLDASTSRAENCTFEGNNATGHGGAIAAYNTSSLDLHANYPTTLLASERPEESRAPDDTQAILATSCDPLTQQCSALHNNQADSDGDTAGYGGAIYNSGSELKINLTYLQRNLAYYGGAIYQVGIASTAALTNTLIYSNTATQPLGAGIHCSSGDFDLTHVTIAHNTGGAGFSGLASSATNSIAWGNAAGGFTVAPTASDCNIDQSGLAGASIDPQFAAPGAGEDYHLSSGSPAIDACASGLPIDLDNIPRPLGSGYDMGAYEKYLVDVSVSKTVSGASFEPGQAVTFILSIANDSASDLSATGILITDTFTLLSDLAFTSDLALVDTGYLPPYVWQAPDLAPGESGVITVTGNLLAPLAAGVYTNTAIIHALQDPSGPNNTASVTFTVLNLPPAFTSAAPTTADPGVLYTYNITSEDPNGLPLTISAAGLPAWLTLTDHGDGTATLSGTPAAADGGEHAITITVTDSGGLTDTQNFIITVKTSAIYLPTILKSPN